MFISQTPVSFTRARVATAVVVVAPRRRGREDAMERTVRKFRKEPKGGFNEGGLLIRCFVKWGFIRTSAFEKLLMLFWQLPSQSANNTALIKIELQVQFHSS